MFAAATRPIFGLG